MKKHLIAIVLTLATLVGLLVVPAYADSLCSVEAAHRAAHQDSGNACGYVKAVQGQSCTHDCKADGCSIKKVLVCEKAEHTHDGGCYYSNGKLKCDLSEHTHSWSDSCYKHEYDCSHIHNDSCGYVEAVEGKPCTFSHTHTKDCRPFVEPPYYADYEEDVEYVQPGLEELAQAENYFVTCRVLNVRADASTDLDRIGKVRRGDVVSVVAWDGDWARIEWDGAFAYVYGAYITKA